MVALDDFEAVFGTQWTYSSTIQTDVSSRRRGLGGQLFFDRMLAQLKIKNHNTLYPPHSAKDLLTLHRNIASAGIAEHHKQSLLYYLVKDRAFYLNETEALEADFARDSHLPPRYWRCVEGFWYLDHFQWALAVDSLVHPAVTPPTFPEEILQALLQHAKEENPELPMLYFNVVSPSLSNPELAEAYFCYIAHISVTEAYYFMRERPEEEQEMLFRFLIREALADYRSSERAARGLELIELPFTKEEESEFENFLLEGGGQTYHGARDAVMTRKMATGKFREALQIGQHLKGRHLNDLNWDPIKAAITEGLGPRNTPNVETFQ